MADEVNDGGPAYPCGWNGFGEGFADPLYHGMTLRDRFAMAAPPTPHDFPWPSAPDRSAFQPDDEAYINARAIWWASRDAAWAYAYADAMMARRDIK